MKTSWVCAWALCAVLLIGATISVTTAFGQKSSGQASGAKLTMSAMDTDKDGTVSKEEFMTYMDVQFDRANVDHDGTLDRQEMEQLRKNLSVATKQ
jgi:Ca2+-binding EF-hand superfamily protein